MGLKPLSLSAQEWDELLFIPWRERMSVKGLFPHEACRGKKADCSWPCVVNLSQPGLEPTAVGGESDAHLLKLAPQTIRHWLELYLGIRYSGKGIWGSRLPWPLLPQPEIWEILRRHELETWNQRLLKGVSVYEQKAFLLGVTGEYPILLLWRKPHPWELLHIQAQGYRVINLYTSYQDFLSDGNSPRWDPGTFVLHDLKHAYEFFEDRKRYLGQILLYRLMVSLQTDEDFLQSLDSHGDWAKAFYYLISDMNTHPIHWLKTAEAIFKIHSQSNAWTKLWNREAPKQGWPLKLREWASCINDLKPSELTLFWDTLTDITIWGENLQSQVIKIESASPLPPTATAPVLESGSVENAR